MERASGRARDRAQCGEGEGRRKMINGWFNIVNIRLCTGKHKSGTDATGQLRMVGVCVCVV